MSLRKAFCPNCGEQTQIDDTKEFCFCLSCGNKIMVPKREQPQIIENTSVSEHEPRQRAQTESYSSTNNNVADNKSIIEDKLKEAQFYYDLSREKKEYVADGREPAYYLKGQDLLVDLSQQHPSDYRIWWELCKPMDFMVILDGEISENASSINTTYFDKALDLAPLDKKMELVKQHDKYLELKNPIIERVEAEKQAIIQAEKEERDRKLREEQAAAEERNRILMQQQREEQERIERERIEAERKAAEIWPALARGDYSSIDNSLFEFRNAEGISIIGTFKFMANVMYVSAFHIDAAKNNMLYLDQSLAIRFNERGEAIKYDGKPVIVSGFEPSRNKICILVDSQGNYTVNGIPLRQDADYVANLSKTAKKPLALFKKVFL